MPRLRKGFEKSITCSRSAVIVSGAIARSASCQQYTRSMIGYWHHHVVRPSVRLSVTLCIVALRVGVQGYTLYQRVSSRHVPICPFRLFCCRMYRLATKPTKSQVEENVKVRFWDRQSGMHWSCYVLLFTDFVSYWSLVCHAQWSRLSRQSLGAFINSTRAYQPFINL